MNQAVEPNQTKWLGKAARAGRRRATEPPETGQLAALLTGGGRVLRRMGLILWILALLCFVLAAFVWWELLRV